MSESPSPAQPYPILEFDPAPEAVIEPARILKSIDAPEHCVVCFFQEAIAKVCRERAAKTLFSLKWEDGPHPLYEIDVDGKRLAILHPGVGAPMAAGLLEGQANRSWTSHRSRVRRAR